MLHPEKGLLCDFCESERSAHTHCFRCGRAICYEHSTPVRGTVIKKRVKGLPEVAYREEYSESEMTLAGLLHLVPLAKRREYEGRLEELEGQPVEPEEVQVEGYIGYACPDCAALVRDRQVEGVWLAEELEAGSEAG